jgi:hypothetical protein
MAKRKSNQSFQNSNNQLNNRNQSNLYSNNNKRGSGREPVIPNKGASSGLKTRNKYLQDFEKLKAGYKSKKGEC